MPWILVLFSVNDPISVYQTAPSEAKIYAAGFGLLWGVGSVMFGQGVDIVGNALGFAIILVGDLCGRSVRSTKRVHWFPRVYWIAAAAAAILAMMANRLFLPPPVRV